MAIIGNIIKSGIDIRAFFKGEETDVVAAQIDQLKGLLNQAGDTAFGKYYGFSTLLEHEDPRNAFAERVPIFDYHELHDAWWEKQQKYPDITWPGRPDFFALSSGTTGKSSKRIPITNEMMQSMRKVGIDLVTSLKAFDLPQEVYEKEIFVLSSSANLNENDEGFEEGEISGINVRNFPGWYDFFYRPGKEIAEIDNWDERLNMIVKHAPEWDIGAMAGIPSWVLMAVKAIIKEHNLETIHDIWPHLSVYSTGGVAFEPYRKNFEEVTARPLTIIDTYLASEGFIGYTFEPDSMAMKLAFHHGLYYEFIPFDKRGFDGTGNLLENPEIHHWEDVEEGKDYALLISTCAGAWRYLIGDTIKFTHKEKAAFVLTGRTKFFLNVVGSQLSEEKMNAAVKVVSDTLQIPIEEFSVAALQDGEGKYYHQWVLASEESGDAEKAREVLDASLKEANKNYKVARSKALEDIKVILTTKEKYYNWLEQQKKKGGQVKTPKVMSDEKMRSLLEFLEG